MNSNSLMALELLTMGKMDVRGWWKRVGRESHGQMMKLGYIKTVPNKTGTVWYVKITARGKERLK